MKKKYIIGALIAIFGVIFIFSFVIKPKQSEMNTIRLASSPGPLSRHRQCSCSHPSNRI